MTEKKSGLNVELPAKGSSFPIILLSSMDSSMGGSEMAGGTLSATAALAADVIELELSEMFSVLCRLIDHNRRGLSFEDDLQRKSNLVNIAVTFTISVTQYNFSP